MNGSPFLKEAIAILKNKGYEVTNYGLVNKDHARSAEMEHPVTHLRAFVSAEEIRFYYVTLRLVKLNIMPIPPTSGMLDKVENTILEVVNLIVKENL